MWHPAVHSCPEHRCKDHKLALIDAVLALTHVEHEHNVASEIVTLLLIAALIVVRVRGGHRFASR